MRILFFLFLVGLACGQGSFGAYTASNLPRNTLWTSKKFEFTRLLGRTADPCNILAATDCQTVPDSQVTVLLPSANHPNQNVISAGNQPITVFGNFPDFATMTPVFWLSVIERGCSEVDTTLGSAAGGTFNIAGTSFTFKIPLTWVSATAELEGSPRMLCVQKTAALAYVYTGFKIGVVWACNNVDVLSSCANLPIGAGYEQLNLDQYQQRRARATCCESNLGAEDTLKVGQCIMSPLDNPLAPTTCCGSAAVEVSQERCCNAQLQTTAWHSTACSCNRANVACPSKEFCCLPSKYNELNWVAEAQGECYNPSTHQCCDTGARYDPGMQQCCVVNGLQSLNVPCPCELDSHCQGPTNVNSTLKMTSRCCKQVNTTTWNEQPQCDKYANYPTGTDSYQSQRCSGSCFDYSYQICCNGVACVKSFEKCCNSTCCNRFTQTCEWALRSGTPGNRYNWDGFMVYYEQCSTVEQMQPLLAEWIFVYPMVLLIITFLCTGATLVFANKASSRSYAAIEKAMINIALVAIVCSLGFYFSPAWKYSLVILTVQLFTILTAACRIRSINIWCLVLQIVLCIYLVDPFHGNYYLTLAVSRTTQYRADREAAGLVHFLGKMWRSQASADQTFAFCAWHYAGYMKYDPQLRDTDRFDNPAKTTFGYCERPYVLLLLVFASIVYVCVLLQLIFTIFALVLRFNKPQVKLVVQEEAENYYE